MKPGLVVAVLLILAPAWGAIGFAHAPQAQQERAASSPERPTILVMLRLPPEHYRPQADYGGGYGNNLSRSALKRLARSIAREHKLALVSDWPMPLIGLDCFVMTSTTGQSAEDAAAEVSRDPRVEWSQPLQQFEAMTAPPSYNDPLLAAEPAVRLWRLPDLHQLATGRGVIVAVIDSKIDGAHLDLRGQLSGEKNFTASASRAAEQHGTEVAGIIAAKANNGAGIVGVAPQARLLALRACWQDRARTICDSLSLAKAVHYAIERRAQVINLSVAGPYDRLLAKLLQAGLDGGRTIVAAHDSKLFGGGFPASLPGVIAVSNEPVATARSGVYIAPGKGVPTTQPGGRWNLVSGSSFAAAHVSGLMALVRERRPRGDWMPLNASSSKGGEIDACSTLLRGVGNCDCACASARSAMVKPAR